jgi:hypothetical protein
MLTTMHTTPTPMNPVIPHNPYTIQYVAPTAEAQGILNAIRAALHGWWAARDQLRAATQQSAQRLIQISTGDGYGQGPASDSEAPTTVLESMQRVKAWEAILCDLTDSFTTYTRCLDDKGQCLIDTERTTLINELRDRYKVPDCVRACFEIPRFDTDQASAD